MFGLGFLCSDAAQVPKLAREGEGRMALTARPCTEAEGPSSLLPCPQVQRGQLVWLCTRPSHRACLLNNSRLKPPAKTYRELVVWGELRWIQPRWESRGAWGGTCLCFHKVLPRTNSFFGWDPGSSRSRE